MYEIIVKQTVLPFQISPVLILAIYYSKEIYMYHKIGSVSTQESEAAEDW